MPPITTPSKQLLLEKQNKFSYFFCNYLKYQKPIGITPFSCKKILTRYILIVNNYLRITIYDVY